MNKFISGLKFDGNGLMPAVIQDYKNNEVLMVAYMNDVAVKKTIETKRCWKNPPMLPRSPPKKPPTCAPDVAGVADVEAAGAAPWSMTEDATTVVPFTVPCTMTASPVVIAETVEVAPPLLTVAFVASTEYVTLLLFVTVSVEPLIEATVPPITGSPLPVMLVIDAPAPFGPPPVPGTTPSLILVAVMVVPLTVPCTMIVSPVVIAEIVEAAPAFVTVAFVASTV